MQLNVKLEEHVTHIISEENNVRISICDEAETPDIKNSGIGILIFKGKIKNIFQVEKGLDIQGNQWDKLILIEIPSKMNSQDVLRGFINQAVENDVKLPKFLKKEDVAIDVEQTVMEFVQQQIWIINRFGTDHILVKSSKLPTKVQHRWNSKVSKVPFYIDMPDSKAEIQWIKRNEMVIKAGAIMKKDAPLNKDGSLGFAAKMGQKVRDDYQQYFKDFKTTEDITLKSVNEVSLFLYFAGMNSWLVFKDAYGKTIDAWTRVD